MDHVALNKGQETIYDSRGQTSRSNCMQKAGNRLKLVHARGTAATGLSLGLALAVSRTLSKGGKEAS